jgi:hypothetical protein
MNKPDQATSQRPESSAGRMPLKEVSWKTGSTPQISATACAVSMSNPMYSPFSSKLSSGGYDGSVQTVNSPSLTKSPGGEIEATASPDVGSSVSSVESSSDPQPATARLANAATSASSAPMRPDLNSANTLAPLRAIGPGADFI